MNKNICLKFGVWALLSVAVVPAVAQKVNVGYDKNTDFSRYRTYTRMEPGMTPSRPILYATVVGSIDHELKSKGLGKADSDGDLLVVPSGGMEFGINQAAGTPILNTYSGIPPTVDATMWVGAAGPANLMAPYVPEGTLLLTFIDRVSNKVVWSGTVTQKFDIENKKDSLDRVDKAIVKLIAQFPPKKK